ncbi:solute carrier family 22 member 16 isoform X2 [Erinaceus europaeus]|uniref:Solute carrier family 22 member 16 isoform X2 n=1 Tax=Erinaceus europaeus TaxID=9365 RepID=A0ABM3XCR7_ERIEU|nr:solute carrier family 22 member 16 isoform X2 [Erinaceus europaeus]
MADSWTTLPWGQGGPDGKLRPSWEAEELDQYLARKQWLRGRRPPSQDNAAFPEQPAARRGSSPGGARPSTAGPGAGTAGRPGGPPRVLLDAAGWVSKTPEAGEKQLPRRPGPGAATPRNLERIFDRVGHSGRFQLFFYFICAVQNISCGIHYFASLLMTIEPFHTCRPPGNVSQVLFNNISRKRVDDLLTLFSRGQENHITVQLQNGEVWDLSECEMSHKENKTLSSRSDKNGFRTKHPCMHGYIYDKSKWDNNVVTNWDLVCSQELLSKLIKSTFMLGIMLGAVIFGQLSDRVGRRFVLWPTSTGIFLFGVIAALSFDYYSFLMVRFLLALAVGGYHVVVFVYVMEIFGRKCRTWAAIFINSFFSLGTMIVALVGYLVRTWWLYQLILSTLTVPFVIFCWMLPETPLWLLARGKYEEAQRVVDMIASWNRKSPCRLREFLILNVSGPGGVTDIPSYIFLYAGVYLFGRRKAMIFFLMLNALICGVTIMIPQKYHICLMVAKIVGKFAIVAVFGIVFLYTAELYPTIVRCHAMGSGTLVSFIGSMILPFVMDLSPVWIFMPQLLVGILTIVSSVVALMLPETLGKPLAATWGENDVLSVEQDRQSEKFLPTTNNIELGKVDVLHSQGPTFSE